jgi:hypothetical protein
MLGPARAIKTIQGGVNVANPGDTVAIDSGTYVETVVVNKNITLTGSATSANLNVNNSATLTMNAAFTGGCEVAAGATLTGTGSVGSLTLDSGGTLTGNMNVTGTALLTPGSTFSTALTNSSTYSTLSASGITTLTGANLSVTPLFTPTPGSSFTMITGAVSGTFNGLAEGTTFNTGGATFRIHYAPSSVTLTTAPGPSPPR